MTIACKDTAEVEPGTVTINECGSILTSTSATFSWNDPNQTVSTIYDFWVGSMPLSNDIYDLAGGGSFNGSSVTVSNLPTDGRTIYKTLYVFANGSAGGITDTIQCTCTAVNITVEPFCATYLNIRDAGLPTNCYDEMNDGDRRDSHLAEFLLARPDVCDFSVDEPAEQVCALDPAVPSNPVTIPAPSGNDDGPMLQSIINNNPGRDLVGQGLYNLASTVNIPASTVRLFSVPSIITGTQTVAYNTNGQGVEFYDSPIDGNNSNRLSTGWNFASTADNFVVVRSGLRDIRNTQSTPCAAIRNRGGTNYRIACNQFINLLNANSSGSNIMRAIWDQGSGGIPAPYGDIFNNVAENLQSSGVDPASDAEFFAHQGFVPTPGSRIRVMANRCLHAGKRLTKSQDPDLFVGSNIYDWIDRVGPLGNRKQQHVVGIQVDADRVTMVNNRSIISGEGEYDGLVSILYNSGRTFSDVHVRCNVFELLDQPPQNFYGLGFELKGASNLTTNIVNSSIKDNIITGPGATNHIFSIGGSFPPAGPIAGLDMSGNLVSVPVLISDYRGSGATYVP